MRKYCWAAALVLSVVIFASAVWAAAPTAKVVIEPISGDRIKALGLVGRDTTSITGGINVVGAGTNVYLSATGTDPDKGKIASSNIVLWGTPNGSGATLSQTLKRDGSVVPGMWTLTTDVVGDYSVQATVTDDQGETSDPVTQVITAANYVGISNCAICHSGGVQADKVTEWSGTKHAVMLKEGLNGNKEGDHYSKSCARCHTVGFNVNPAANNGGFDDVMASTGYTYPTHMQPGNFEAMPAALQNLANIQCENCHGPGGSHMGQKAKIAVSYDAGICLTCHGALANHAIGDQWGSSAHAAGAVETSAVCVKCHTGRGFIEFSSKGLTDITYQGVDREYNPISCQACHDPHSAENEKQLRRLDDVTLENGVTVTSGGLGKICERCHHSRRNAPEYVKKFSTRMNPHGNPQTDMLVGSNTPSWGEDIPSSGHKYAAEDACVTCHMAETPAKGMPGRNRVGGHSYRMKWDGGTPDDPSDDVENTAACEKCHGPLESFDKEASVDYDGDGKIEGVQTEVKGLMTKLALLIPPIGQDKITLDSTFTTDQLSAVYNYNFVLNDGSFGVHNTKYAVGLLRTSIAHMGGQIITSVEADAARPGVPSAYVLGQNAPNPFNPETSIRYSIPKASVVRLSVFSTSGQKVIDLVSESQAAGSYVVRWDGTDTVGRKVSAGVYVYSLQSEGYSATRKMMLLP